MMPKRKTEAKNEAKNEGEQKVSMYGSYYAIIIRKETFIRLIKNQ